MRRQQPLFQPIQIRRRAHNRAAPLAAQANPPIQQNPPAAAPAIQAQDQPEVGAGSAPTHRGRWYS